MFSSKNTLSICRKSLGFSEDDFIIVYSGRINHEKGISELIDALLNLRNYPQIKLMVLGSSFFDNAKIEDEFISSLKNKAKEIEDKIVFTGYIPYNQVPDYLQLADIAVLPSMWEEPFGLTIVEAMAMGLPLITTRSGGIPEICEGTAIIVERDNIVNNLVSSILDLYKHSEKRHEMAEASLKRAKLFDKETYAKNIFAAIENI
jgi:glycosyltransferase involved in cell wall biosynthesis